MHKALYPREDIVKLYGKITELARGLVNIENCMDAEILKLKEYTKKFTKRERLQRPVTIKIEIT